MRLEIGVYAIHGHDGSPFPLPGSNGFFRLQQKNDRRRLKGEPEPPGDDFAVRKSTPPSISMAGQGSDGRIIATQW
jgi:hypothetical protein